MQSDREAERERERKRKRECERECEREQEEEKGECAKKASVVQAIRSQRPSMLTCSLIAVKFPRCDRKEPRMSSPPMDSQINLG